MNTHTRYSLTSKQLHTQHNEAFPSLLHIPPRTCLPFQCYSRYTKKKTNLLDWSVRFLHTLGLSSKSRLHFHSSNQFIFQTRMYTQLSQYWDYQIIADAKDYTHMQKNYEFLIISWTRPAAALEQRYLIYYKDTLARYFQQISQG